MTPEERQAFKQRMKDLKSYREQNPGKGYWDWKRKIEEYKGLNIDQDDTYDYRGFYNEDPVRAYQMLEDNPDAHFIDKYKTPKHPTFSDESIYSNETTPGGHWEYKNGKDVYNFSDYTFKHSDETLDYLKWADPNTVAVYKGGAVLPEVKVTAYRPGGETGEDEITKILKQKRAEALKKSQTRTSGIQPIVAGKPNPISREDWEKQRAADLAKARQELADTQKLSESYGLGMLFGDKTEVAQKKVKALEEATYQPVIGGYVGPGCIYTATDNYGEKYRQASNVTFESLPPSVSGFTEVDRSQVQPGDIVIRHGEGTNRHGMIFDSKAPDGTWLYNHSNGGSGAQNYRHKGRYPSTPESLHVYRFTGTHQDSINWQKQPTRYVTGGVTGEDDLLQKYTPEQQELIKRGWSKPGKQVSESRKEEVKAKADKLDREIKRVSEAIKQGLVNPAPSKEQLQETAERQYDERMEKAYPYKLMGRSLWEAAKLTSAGIGISNGIRQLKGLPITNLGNYSELGGMAADFAEGTKALGEANWDEAAENAVQVGVGETARRNYKPYTELDGYTGEDITPTSAKLKYKGLIGLGLAGNVYQVYDSTRKILGLADGGETGDDDLKQKFYEATGRNKYGVPIEQGLKPVFDLEDAANLTPAGDVLSAKDTYEAVRDKNWLGAGLAALGMVPIVPNISRYVKHGKLKPHAVPTVNPNKDQALIDAQLKMLQELAEKKAKISNEQYGVVERMMDDPAYLRRAEEVQKQFGDDYSMPYADAFISYNGDPASLPQVALSDDYRSFGNMERLSDGSFLYHRSRVIDQPYNAEHEVGHFVDMLKAGGGDADKGNNMFKEMSKDLKEGIDRHDRYFMMPTEQKSHMNQLREWMFQNNMIPTRDTKVDVNTLKKALKAVDEVSGMEGVVRASKQFGDMKLYRKWFNSIPLVDATTKVDEYAKQYV